MAGHGAARLWFCCKRRRQSVLMSPFSTARPRRFRCCTQSSANECLFEFSRCRAAGGCLWVRADVARAGVEVYAAHRSLAPQRLVRIDLQANTTIDRSTVCGRLWYISQTVVACVVHMRSAPFVPTVSSSTDTEACADQTACFLFITA